MSLKLLDDVILSLISSLTGQISILRSLATFTAFFIIDFLIVAGWLSVDNYCTCSFLPVGVLIPIDLTPFTPLYIIIIFLGIMGVPGIYRGVVTSCLLHGDCIETPPLVSWSLTRQEFYCHVISLIFYAIVMLTTRLINISSVCKFQLSKKNMLPFFFFKLKVTYILDFLVL